MCDEECTNNDAAPPPLIEVNLLRSDLNAARNYPNNSIRTSKYTAWTCIPQSLLNQFRTVSNAYFLFVTIITLIPTVSPVNPLSTMLPLLIVVGVGMWKDVWEDNKRRSCDRIVNSVIVQVLRGTDFVPTPSSEVQVGDVILCKLGEEVLADAVVLKTSLADGVTYIETSNLDGETNAKTRRAMPQTVDALGTIEDIIENCLPDPAVRAHFVSHGTTRDWKEDIFRSSPGNARGDPPAGFGLSLPTDQGSSMQPQRGDVAGADSPTLDTFKTHDGHTGGTVSGLEQGMLACECSGPGPRQPTGSREQDTQVERTGADVEPANVKNPFHQRRFSLSEHFVVGREMPLPSGMADLSEAYEGRHGLSTASCVGPSSHLPCPPNAQNVGESAAGSIAAGSNMGSGGVVLLGAPPCPDLHSWIGQLRLRDGRVVPLSIEQFLPRGCIIRNTEWVLCAAVYVGSHSKMLLNLQKKEDKYSITSLRINTLNIMLLLVHQLTLITLCALAVVWRGDRLSSKDGGRSGHTTWYIQWALNKHTASEYFGLLYLTNFVLLSYLIPISLYVTMELNKALQMFLIASDRRMANYDEFNGVLRYSRPRTSTLNTQLAHVRYIFTDKTGTLTENVMTYVGGCTTTERHDEQETPGALGEAFLRLAKTRRFTNVSSREPLASSDPVTCPQGTPQPRNGSDFDEDAMENEPIFRYLRNLSLCHNVVCFDRPEVESAAAAAAAAGGHGASLSAVPPGYPYGVVQRSFVLDANVRSIRSGDVCDAGDPPFERPVSLLTPTNTSVFGATPSNGVGRFLHGHTGSASWFMTRHSDALMHERSMTMCREVRELRDESKIYEGQSLDEIALVYAARDNLFALQRRTAKHIFVKVLQKTMCYEVVAELQFSSRRKLMSILLFRCPEFDDSSASSGDDVRISYRRQPQGGAVRQTPPGLRHTSNLLSQQKIVNVLGEQKGVPMTPVEGDTDCDGAKSHEQRFLMLIKGADSSMMAILNKQNPRNHELKESFEVEIDGMAKKGLRTLVLGQRWVSEKEVREWLPVFNEAQCCVRNREEELHKAYALLEKDIDLVGTTAVSDRLQEGVPETITFFMQAGIVLWMLTGDKRETAVTIACTSGIIEPGCEGFVSHLDACSAAAAFDDLQKAAHDACVRGELQLQLDALLDMCNKSEICGRDARSVVLVVDGLTLDIIFADQGFTSTFFSIGERCRSGVCCRMTPLQKSKVVKLFQRNTGGITLAVGDGANDVSMIQESNIGIGIMGLEGSQAELASDYAIPKFRFLKRLLVVHGRFSLYRDAHCFVYSLHKNSFLASAVVAYAVFSGFSGMIMIDSWLVSLFNLVYCSLQPVLLGMYDKDVEDELAESVPLLYPPMAREGMFFRWDYIAKWFFDGIIIGVAVFLLMYHVVGVDDSLYPYLSASVEDYGTLYFLLLLTMVNLRAVSAVVCYNVVSVLCLVLCFAIIPLVTILYSQIPNVFGSNRCVYIALSVLGNIKFWLMFVLCFGIYIVYVMGVNAYIALFMPWLNGEPAMRAAWESPYRLEHLAKVKLLKQRASRKKR